MLRKRGSRTPPKPVVLPRLAWSFDSTAAAARHLGCSKREMSRHLNGHANGPNGWQLVRIEDLIKIKTRNFS
jgi:hypothetical protein